MDGDWCRRKSHDQPVYIEEIMDLLLVLEFQKRFIRLLALRTVYETLLSPKGICLIELSLFSTYLDLRELGEGLEAQKYLEASLKRAKGLCLPR